MKKWLFCMVCSLFILSIMPGIVYAQSKPKRDVSKDTKLNVPKLPSVSSKDTKLNVPKLPSVSPKKQTNNRQRKFRRKNNKSDKDKTTYLIVNGYSSELKEALPYHAGGKYLSVQTDGKTWNIDMLPYWCKTTKDSNGFLLEYRANPLRGERNGFFVLRSNNYVVHIYLKQAGRPNLNVQILDEKMEHNVYRSGYPGRCVVISAKILITGGYGTVFQLVSSLYDYKGEYVQAKKGYRSFSNSNYKFTKQSEDFFPQSDAPFTFNVEWVIPNDALKLKPKKTCIRCDLKILKSVRNDNVECASASIYIFTKRKKGKTVTSSYPL